MPNDPTSGGMKSFKVTDQNGQVYILSMVDQLARNGVSSSIKFTQQELTEEQKAQARLNIGAAKLEEEPMNKFYFRTSSICGYELTGNTPLVDLVPQNSKVLTLYRSDGDMTNDGSSNFLSGKNVNKLSFASVTVGSNLPIQSYGFEATSLSIKVRIPEQALETGAQSEIGQFTLTIRTWDRIEPKSIYIDVTQFPDSSWKALYRSTRPIELYLNAPDSLVSLIDKSIESEFIGDTIHPYLDLVFETDSIVKPNMTEFITR